MSIIIDELVESQAETLPSSTGVVLGLDVGTSGVRAALFDEQANETVAVKISRDPSLLSDFTELDPLCLVDEVIKAIDQLLDSHQHIGKVETIAISTFWHSLLGIDAQGLPTTAVLTWADTRATGIAKAFRLEFNEADIHRRTGCRFHSSYWPAKLR